MSDSSNNQKIPKAIIDLLVSDVLIKNGINIENAKEKLNDEQKQLLKELVNDLSQQVDSFVKSPTTNKEEK